MTNCGIIREEEGVNENEEMKAAVDVSFYNSGSSSSSSFSSSSSSFYFDCGINHTTSVFFFTIAALRRRELLAHGKGLSPKPSRSWPA
jgi:hypothetical protein